jgi:hypothetical protein
MARLGAPARGVGLPIQLREHNTGTSRSRQALELPGNLGHLFLALVLRIVGFDDSR